MKTEKLNNNTITDTINQTFRTTKNTAKIAGKKVSNFVKNHPLEFKLAAKIAIFAAGIISTIFQPISTIIGFTAGLFLSKHIDKAALKLAEVFKKSNTLIKALMITAGVITPFVPVIGGICTGALVGSETRKLFF
ncbi:MAG: hypothetical protein VX777_10200 [Chlamydiota bacterium]|nr:hypothetical protein [Chlamydiota bacterium]